MSIIQALFRWWRDLHAELPRSPHCRCREHDGGPHGSATGDHLCAAGCLIHGPRCSCGLYLVPK